MPTTTIAFFPAHPSQLWMLRPVADSLGTDAKPVWILRDKDCTLELARAFGLKHHVVSRAATGLLGNAAEMGRNIFRCAGLGRRLGIDLWVSKYGAANIAARLTGGRSVSFNDDDADIVPLIAWTSYPFADFVLAPGVTRMGRFAGKTLRYAGCHELFYLHPNRFTPDENIFAELGIGQDQAFAVLRLSALHAHHDLGVKGVSESLTRKIIHLLEPRTRVFISSEKPLPAEFETHRITIPVERMHHALAFADFFIGDSQTMTAEAAVLGTPALRLNSFVGRISYLRDLEDFQLAFGFLPGEEQKLLATLENLLRKPDRKTTFRSRRREMLAARIDPVPWFAGILLRLAAGSGRREIIDFAKGEP